MRSHHLIATFLISLASAIVAIGFGAPRSTEAVIAPIYIERERESITGNCDRPALCRLATVLDTVTQREQRYAAQRGEVDITANVPVRIAAALLAAITLLAAACGDDEAQVPDDSLPTATTSQTAATSDASPSPAATTPAATVTPAPVPSDWKSYTDAERGFSFKYPERLSASEPTTEGSESGSAGLRSLWVNDADDPLNGFAVWVYENGRGQTTGGLTIEEWARDFIACYDGSLKTSRLDGEEAIVCSQPNTIGPPGFAAIAEHAGRIYVIETGGHLSEADFKSIVESFRYQ